MSSKVNKNQLTETPDDNQIIELLSRFAPVPSARFTEKMENAPWKLKVSQQKQRLFNYSKPKLRGLIGIAIIISILAIISLSFFPSVQAVARQIIYSFISESSDQIIIQATLSAPEELFHYSDPAHFPLSNQAAHQQAGFEVKEIINLPAGVNKVGSRYDSSYSQVITLYQGSGYDLFLTQRPNGNGEDIFSIGSTAQVYLVKIGDHEGEYVNGGWKAVSTQIITDTINPGNQTSISAVWDNDLPQHTLRWQADDFIYELRSIGEGGPTQSELIMLANGLK
jgi:hypothetical protein